MSPVRDSLTIEIRYRPAGTDEAFHIWLAVTDLPNASATELSRLMLGPLSTFHPDYEFKLFVKGV